MQKKSASFTELNTSGRIALFLNFKRRKGRLRIVFVCLGNICRSPTAEILFNHFRKGDDVIAYSRGTDYWHYGKPVCSVMKEVLEDEGIHVYERRAKFIVPSEVKRFDMIMPVDKAVEKYLRSTLSKRHHRKIVPFYLFTGGKEVPDPYGKGKQEALRTFRIIKSGIENLLKIFC